MLFIYFFFRTRFRYFYAPLERIHYMTYTKIINILVTGLINNGFICTKFIYIYEADHNHNDDDVWIFGLKEIKRDIFNIEKKNADKFVYLATVTGLWHSCGMTRILWNNIYTIWFDYFLRLLFYKFNNGMKDYNSYSTQSQIKILPLLKIYIYT